MIAEKALPKPSPKATLKSSLSPAPWLPPIESERDNTPSK